MRTSEADEEYHRLKDYVLKCLPNHRHSLHECCKCYWQSRQYLLTEDGILTNGCQKVISQMHPKVLSQLHEAHQGSTRNKQRAHLTVY